MYKENLNAIATRALLDDEFEAAILNGHRREKLREFDLSENQIEELMAIRASDLDEFIHHLVKLMSRSRWPAMFETVGA
jgi:hypothetical protein